MWRFDELCSRRTDITDLNQLRKKCDERMVHKCFRYLWVGHFKIVFGIGMHRNLFTIRMKFESIKQKCFVILVSIFQHFSDREIVDACRML